MEREGWKGGEIGGGGKVDVGDIGKGNGRGEVREKKDEEGKREGRHVREKGWI